MKRWKNQTEQNGKPKEYPVGSGSGNLQLQPCNFITIGLFYDDFF